MANFYEEIGIPKPKEPKMKGLMGQEDKSKGKPILLVDTETGINGVDRFRIMHPIGEASRDSIPVYRAALIAEHYTFYSEMELQDVFVAVKYVHMDQEPEAFNKLQREVDKNDLIVRHNQYLLGIRRPFTYDRYFCVVFPFMELGSLRSIMANRFPLGAPEDCILMALKETLKGLSVIHGCSQVHREISAGHIFVNGKPEIKLAFSASVYDLQTDENQDSYSPFLPVASICKWAAAPEVYQSDNSDQYTSKADIWLIGITALELAYGGLRVMNRESLMSMVMKINQKKRLSKKGNKVGDLKGKGKMKLPFGPCLNPLDQSKKRVFSDGLEDMVVKCLDLDPANRPTADELLQNEIFANVDYAVFYRHNLFE